MKENYIIYNIDEYSFTPEVFNKILNAEEIARADQFIIDKDRLKYKIQRVLIKNYLSSIINIRPEQIEIIKSKTGKPSINKNPLFFNLSHSGSYLLIATSTLEIGADIEAIDNSRDFDKIAHRVMHPSELSIFMSARSNQRREYFLDIWTKKEAYTKYLGSGLATPFSAIEINEVTNIEIKSQKTNSYHWAIVTEKKA